MTEEQQAVYKKSLEYMEYAKKRQSDLLFHQDLDPASEKLKEEKRLAILRACNAEESARRAWICFFIALSICIILATVLNNKIDKSYERGRSVGYEDGYGDGYFDAGVEFSQRSSSGYSTKSSTRTSQSDIVYVTRTGTKYHKAGCSYLKSKIEMTLEEAEDEGYTPCSRCY